MTKKQFEELGKFFVDLGKYLITAILFGKIFQEHWNIAWGWFLLVSLTSVAFVAFGVWLMHFGKKENATPNTTPQLPNVTEVKKGIFHIQHAEINK